MSFTSGFFNAIDKDRMYDSLQVSQLFDGLIRDGIFASIGTCFVVTLNHDFVVNVGIGRAWFDHTWSYNDAIMPVQLPVSEVFLDRIDAIVLEVNHEELVRQNSIKVIRGTPSSSPVKPKLINTTYVHQYPLAYITIPEGSTAVEGRFIENCVGTSSTPFVTGILEVMDLDKVLPQWRYQLQYFMDTNTNNFNNWFATIKAAYAANWQAFLKWEQDSKDQYDQWFDVTKGQVLDWFDNLKDTLGENPAVNLKLQIDALSETMFKRHFNLAVGSGELKNGVLIGTDTLCEYKTTITKTSPTVVTFTTELTPTNADATYIRTVTTTNATTSHGYLINEGYTVRYRTIPGAVLETAPYSGTRDVAAEIDDVLYDVENANKSATEDDVYIIHDTTNS